MEKKKGSLEIDIINYFYHADHPHGDTALMEINNKNSQTGSFI